MKSRTKQFITVSLIILLLVTVVVIPVSAEATSARPAAPAALRARRESDTSIRIWWSQVPRAHGYTIYRFDAQRDRFVRIATQRGRTKSFHIDANLRTDRTYRYQVRAYRTAGSKTHRSEPTHAVRARATTRNSRIVNARGITAPASITVGIRNQRQVRARPIPARHSNHRNKRVLSQSLNYTMANTNIATVSRTGQVTGRREGRTTLRIRTHNGYVRRVTVNVRNYALPRSFNYTNVPEDIAAIIRANKSDFTAVASHFLQNPNSGRGEIYFVQDYFGAPFRMVNDGNVILGAIEPTIRRLLGNVPYSLTITVNGDFVAFDMSYTIEQGPHVSNRLFFNPRLNWDDAEAYENGHVRLARGWYFFGEIHSAPPIIGDPTHPAP